jgi:hypothetical protein
VQHILTGIVDQRDQPATVLQREIPQAEMHAAKLVHFETG